MIAVLMLFYCLKSAAVKFSSIGLYYIHLVYKMKLADMAFVSGCYLLIRQGVQKSFLGGLGGGAHIK